MGVSGRREAAAEWGPQYRVTGSEKSFAMGSGPYQTGTCCSTRLPNAD